MSDHIAHPAKFHQSLVSDYIVCGQDVIASSTTLSCVGCICLFGEISNNLVKNDRDLTERMKSNIRVNTYRLEDSCCIILVELIDSICREWKAEKIERKSRNSYA